jgi:4-diphosphocytidyl-2-C-methyl-D-erythritol kinase
VIVFPNCKINLGLHIIRKRSDGYHDLETCFYPLKLNDALEIVRSTNVIDELEFTSSGIELEDGKTENLCAKAFELLAKDFRQLSNVKMHLHKTIPVSAGLGGGSSDAAFTLKLVNQEFNLGLSTEKLLDYSLQLGSDCPFFIVNKPCIATGRGEFLEVIPLDLSAYKFLIVNPGIQISTAWAFSKLTLSNNQPGNLKTIIQQPVETWKSNLSNDFEKIVFEHFPQVKKIKEDLYNTGAIYSSMSGSGSTVFGIFPKEQKLQYSFAANYLVKELHS